MPKYMLPEKKKIKKDSKDMPAPEHSDEYQRRVTIPANDSILDALDLDDECEVTLTGKIRQLNKSIGTDYKNRDFTIEITSVEAYPVGRSKEEEDQYEKGYGK